VGWLRRTQNLDGCRNDDANDRTKETADQQDDQQFNSWDFLQVERPSLVPAF